MTKEQLKAEIRALLNYDYAEDEDFTATEPMIADLLNRDDREDAKAAAADIMALSVKMYDSREAAEAAIPLYRKLGVEETIYTLTTDKGEWSTAPESHLTPVTDEAERREQVAEKA
jgi:hypothetical protein